MLHGRRSLAARYTNSSGSCPECLQLFHSRTRLNRHLSEGHKRLGVASCLSALIQRGVEPISDETLLVLDALDVDAARKARAGQYVTVWLMCQACGPRAKAVADL